MFFAHEMTDEGLVGDEEFFAVGAVLGFGLIDILIVMIPSW